MATLQDALEVLHKTPTADIYEAVQQRQSKIITDTQQKQLETFETNNPSIPVELKINASSAGKSVSRSPSLNSDDSGTTTESTDSANITTLDAVNTVLESSEPISNLPLFLPAIKTIDQDIGESLSPNDNQINALTKTKDDWLTQKKPEIAKIALGLKGLSVAKVRPISLLSSSHLKSNTIEDTWNDISDLQALEHIEKSVPYNPSMSTQVSSSAKKTASPLTRTDFIKELDAIKKLQTSEHRRIQNLQAKLEKQRQETRVPNQNAQQQAKGKTDDNIHSVKKRISEKVNLASLKDDLLRMQQYQQQEAIKAYPALQLNKSESLGTIREPTRSFLNTALATLNQRKLGVTQPKSLIGVNETDINLLALAIKVDAICDRQENRQFAYMRSGGKKRSTEVAKKFKDLVTQASTDTQKQAIFDKFSESEKLDTRKDIEKACQEAQQALENTASEKPVDKETRKITAPTGPVKLNEVKPADRGILSEYDEIRLTTAEQSLTTLSDQLKQMQKESSDSFNRAASREDKLHNKTSEDPSATPSQDSHPSN